MSPLDPYISHYHYLYSMVLPEEGDATSDHKVTVLNRALKHLQERSSRIDGPGERWRNITVSFWNSRLYEDAKRRRLL